MKTKLIFTAIVVTAIIICSLQKANAQWKLTGNAGTTPATNFLGTTDAKGLVFRTNNAERMRIIGSGSNVGYIGIGISTPKQKLDVNGNINIAAYSGLYINNKRVLGGSSSANLFIGEDAGFNNGGMQNTATGYSALYSNTSGSWNTANGELALASNVSGSYNTATGQSALYSNIDGYSNTANGQYALGSNMSGHENTADGAGALAANTTGSYNAATGVYALRLNKSGSLNTAGGYQALSSNTTGNYNTASGYSALYSNINGHQNTAIGQASLFSNTTGQYNTANGSGSLYNNTIGYSNIAIGVATLYSSTNATNLVAIGDSALYNQATLTLHGEFSDPPARNTAIGSKTLYLNTNGYSNTAIGFQALYHNDNGIGNTAIGTQADVSSGSLINATALGVGATVNATNKVVIGNNFSGMVIGGYAPWSNFSDGRFKENVHENVPGLDFIIKLRPVTYTINTQRLDEHIMKMMPPGIKAKRMQKPEEYEKAREYVRTGFIAQEVEQAANSIGYKFDGVNKPTNSTDTYSLAYGEFVVPLVKAVQELSKENDSLKSRLDKIEQMLANNLQQGSGANTAVTLNSARLEQNNPNPFFNTTSIHYNLPANYKSAQIVITDTNGKTIKQVQVNTAGKGMININAYNLSNGSYTYSLVVDGKIIESKKMMIEK